MNYSYYLVITISVTLVVLFVLNISTQLSDGFNGFDVIGMIILLILGVMIFFIEAPSEEHYSKKDLLESQKIEIILDSDINPIENGTRRDAVLNDSTKHNGIIVYTSDKKLDKTYQKVRYYDSFFYRDDAIIYLYDPNVANNTQSTSAH